MVLVSFLFSPFGRITRSSWWTIQLINSVLMIAVVSVLFTPFLADPSAAIEGLISGKLSVSTSFKLATITPFWINCCANIKRYHDRGKSGIWILIALVPFLGPVWQLIELGSQTGTAGANAFGEPSTGGFGSTNARHQNSSASQAAWNGNIDDAIARAAADFKNQESTPPAKVNSPTKPPGTFGKAARPSFGQRGLS